MLALLWRKSGERLPAAWLGDGRLSSGLSPADQREALCLLRFLFFRQNVVCVNGVLVKEQAGIRPWALMRGRGHAGGKAIEASPLPLEFPTCWDLGALS